MARYFFHLHECGTVTDDLEGIELDSDEAARQTAIRDARSIICEEAKNGAICAACFIEVRDAAGQFVMRVLFRDAVVFTGLGPI